MKMKESQRAGDGTFGAYVVYADDLVTRDYSSWLNVDEQHSYYAVVSDYLLCLFENGSSQTSLMCVKLCGCRAQRVTEDRDTRAFTVSTPDNEDAFYFSSETVEQLNDWISWLNVASQLELDDLLLSDGAPGSSHSSKLWVPCLLSAMQVR